MACEIDRPDPQTLFNRYRDAFSTTVLGGAAIIPESNEWYAVALNYAMAEEFFAISEQQWKERDPRFACCDNLYSIAALDGVFPAAAGFAEGYVQLTGTAGADLSGGTLEITVAGQTFRATGTVPSEIGANGTAIVRVQAITPGPDGNVTSAATGQLVAPPAGVNGTVTVFGGQFCGGTDAEGCEAFRTRYLNRIKYQPRATDAWIRQKLLEWPCATRVCRRAGECCEEPDCDCNNTLNYYVFFDETFECGLPPQCVVDEINTWMFGSPQGYGLGQVEVGVCGRVYTAEAAIIDIVIDGYPCVTAAQKQTIETRLRDFFKTICPSTQLFARQVETIIAQVIGAAETFDVVFRSESDRVRIEDCCGITPECDVMLCLGTVTYAAPEFEATCQ